jgi:NAD(P)-dependent dehydrogenase (short-subunit alcohol dehydrogenase family)
LNASLHAALRGKLSAPRLVVGASGPFPPRDQHAVTRRVKGADPVCGSDSGILLVAADVSNEDEARVICRPDVPALRSYPGLYNNVGIEGEQDPVESYDSKICDEIIQISLKGVFHGMKDVWPYSGRRSQAGM